VFLKSRLEHVQPQRKWRESHFLLEELLMMSLGLVPDLTILDH
jgi:hypothetical protein